MTADQQKNLTSIFGMARVHIAKAKDAAPVGEAMEIANREAQIESYFRERGVTVLPARTTTTP